MKMLPRAPGETQDEWIDRNEKWAKSPEGIEAARVAVAAERKSRALMLETWARDNGIPGDYIQLLFHDAKFRLDSTAMAAVTDSSWRLQVLSGGTGSGKTTAACWWISECEAGEALFVRGVKLARWERYNMDRMDELLLPKKLVIDDLGREFADVNGNLLAILEEVIIDRFEEGRATLITTNLNKAEFIERYKERIASRLCSERGRFYGTGVSDLRARKS